MSRLYDGLRMSLNLDNPFRSTVQKGSSKLLASEINFEQNLSKIMKELRPKDDSDIFSLRWVTKAIEALSEAHTSFNTLATEIQLPASEWNDKLIDACLDCSALVHNICNALNAERIRLIQGQHFPCYCLSSELMDWVTRKLNDSGTKVDNFNCTLLSLKDALCLSKSKVSPKERVLMRAFYGVGVMTLFICSVVTAVLSRRSKPLIDLHIVGNFLWLDAFFDLQVFLHEGIRTELSHGKVTTMKEIAAVIESAQMFLPSTNGIDCKAESPALTIDIKTNESNALSGSSDDEVRQKMLESPAPSIGIKTKESNALGGSSDDEVRQKMLESPALSIGIKTNESNAPSGSSDDEERQKMLESPALSIGIKTNESNALSGSSDDEERQKMLSVLTDSRIAWSRARFVLEASQPSSKFNN